MLGAIKSDIGMDLGPSLFYGQAIPLLPGGFRRDLREGIGCRIRGSYLTC